MKKLPCVNAKYIRFRVGQWNLVVDINILYRETDDDDDDDDDDIEVVEEEPAVYFLLNRPIKVTGSLDRKSTSGFGPLQAKKK